MVIVAVSAIKECFAATAIGTPMECPPPSTSVTVGFVNEEIISAMARPASTSPPTVFSTIIMPSILEFCSAATSCGIRCSYFVVLFCGGKHEMSLHLTDNRHAKNIGFRCRCRRLSQAAESYQRPDCLICPRLRSNGWRLRLFRFESLFLPTLVVLLRMLASLLWLALHSMECC